MKHKHCELIKLWADGAEIQWRRQGCNDWEDIIEPSWVGAFEYRVKPETVRYRVALMRHKGGTPFTHAADTEEQVERWTHSPSFIRWLTDWQEVEV